MTDYELYFGPYTSGTHALHTVLWKIIQEAVECYDLFPNGQYEIETTNEEHNVMFKTNLLFSRRRDSRPVKAVVGDIETLLGY